MPDRRVIHNAVLFDVEGVIAHSDAPTADRDLSVLRSGLDLRTLHQARNGPATYALWQRYSRGRLLPFDYWGPVLAEAGVEDTPETIRIVSEVYRQTWWGLLDQAVLAMADELRRVALEDRREIQLGLLSNSAPEHEPHIPRFVSRFDIAHFSHRTGERKPDSAAFLLAADALGYPPQAIVFIDDKQRNVAAAESLGFTGVHFMHLEQLRSDLSRLGLLA